MTTAESQPVAPDSWELSRRVEAWAGEIRVNVIRIAAIVLFYGRHLIELLMSPKDSPVGGEYHLRVTGVVLVWAALACVLHITLSRRRYPAELKYIASLMDVLMVTLLCAIAGGPKTPLVLLYFAVIAAAPLRWSLRLIYLTTIAAIVGYLFLLAYYAWYLIGFHKYYATPELRIPRSTEAIVVLALLTAGVFAGQVVRQARRMIERYPVSIARETQDVE
jgi:hypothetical protein